MSSSYLIWFWSPVSDMVSQASWCTDLEAPKLCVPSKQDVSSTMSLYAEFWARISSRVPKVPPYTHIPIALIEPIYAVISPCLWCLDTTGLGTQSLIYDCFSAWGHAEPLSWTSWVMGWGQRKGPWKQLTPESKASTMPARSLQILFNHQWLNPGICFWSLPAPH